MTSENWREDAACKTMDPDLFFPEEDDEAGEAEAKSACRLCPVREECLSYALDNEKQFGVFGGMNPRERYNETRRRRRVAARGIMVS